MRTTSLLALFLITTAAACHEDEPSVDAEGCEHLEEGPYTSVTASAARDGTAPAVAADHMAYTATLPAGAVGYVAFAAPEATDYVVFLDKPVPFVVYDATGAMVTLEASETSSPACATIRGKHTFELPVGTAYFGLGPNMGMPFNLVVEEAAGHEEH
jgi:hypothetical protein